MEESAIITWYQTAFILDVPRAFYFEFPNYMIKAFTKTHQLWSEMLVPSHLYLELYERFRLEIEKLPYDREKELFGLMNFIRFGPDNPDFYDEQLGLIKSKYTPKDKDEIILLFRCASLSNKMDLFAKLMEDYRPLILNNPTVITKYIYRKGPVGVHKFMFDVHEAFDFNDRQLIYSYSNYFTTLSYYYRICSIEWNKDEATIKIEFKTDHDDAGVPEYVTVDRIFKQIGRFSLGPERLLADFISKILFQFQFDNTSAIKDFLEKFYDDYHEFAQECCVQINGENLKLIATSESTLELLREIRGIYSINKESFQISLKELLKVVDEPVPRMINFISLDKPYSPSHDLHLFNSPEKIERLETLLGHSVISVLPHDFDYFEYRHILKNFIQTGQRLPKYFSGDAPDFLKIEFPNRNF